MSRATKPQPTSSSKANTKPASSNWKDRLDPVDYE